MHQRSLIRLLLFPSLFSSVTSGLLSIIILAIAIWPAAANTPLLSQYLNGPYGIVAALQNSPEIADFTAAFSVSPVVYNLLLVAVAALVALGVYVILQVMSRIIVDSYDTYHAAHQPSEVSASADEGKEAGGRLVVRLMSLLLWIAYTFFFFSLLMPYCVFIARAGAAELMNWGAIHIIAAFIMLLAMMHVHVIFWRLIALRPRLFGGKLAIMTALYEADEKKS